jgi:hypothetical protein
MTVLREPPPRIDGEAEVDLGRHVTAVATRWWLVALGLIVGAIIGYGVSLGGAQRFAELFGPPTQGRASGRGGPRDPDVPQGRTYVPPVEAPKGPPRTLADIPEEILDFVRNQLPPEERLPRVVLRFAKKDDLWISGMLDKGEELADKPAIIDCPLGKGHVVLFAINPMWRWETHGSHALVFNAVLHWDQLGAGRPATAESTATTAAP